MRLGILSACGIAIALMTLSAACGGDPAPLAPEARAPQPVGTIPNQVVVQSETITVDMTPYFRDPEGAALTYAAASSAAGIVSVSQSASVLTLVGVAPGTATVTVTASDPDRLTASQSFQSVVEARNLPPAVASGIPAQHMTTGQVETVELAPYFSDPEGEALSYAASSNRETVVVASVSGSRLVLAAAGVGTATVTVTAADPAGLMATQTFGVAVAPPNRAPQPQGAISALNLLVADTARLQVSAYFRDPDGDSLSYVAASSDEGVAAATMSADTVRVVGLGVGTATILVTAKDPGGLTAAQSLEVSVGDPNRAPEAVGTIAAQSIGAGDTLTLFVPDYFRDPDGDSLSFEANSDDEGVATATIAGVNGTRLLLAGRRAGTIRVTVTASDPEGLTAIQVVQVTVATTRGGFREDFDGGVRHAGWRAGGASIRFADGLLHLRPTSPTGDLGWVGRDLPLPLTSWELTTRMGRLGQVWPSIAWWTGHERFLVFRLEIGNTNLGFDYFLAVFDGDAQEWRYFANASGDSDAINLERGGLTDFTIRYEEGTIVVIAGETELVRSARLSSVPGFEEVNAAMASVTTIWLAGLNDGEALFDYLEATGVQGAEAADGFRGDSRSVAPLGRLPDSPLKRWNALRPAGR
ncbi:MAG: hypothetical protein OXI18_11250 [bacterium]|nr:hypothetical protein [bacterium]